MFFELIDPEAVMPTVAHVGDAGWDLVANEDVKLAPGERMLVGTGVRVKIGALDKSVGLVCPRSGLAWKDGVTVMNSPGIVDSGYEGEIKVNLVNLGSDAVEYDRGTRIAQFVVVPAVVGIGGAVRGEGGHGSTGV